MHRYTPDPNGRFAGQSGYGFISIARFLSAGQGLNSGSLTLDEVRTQGELALADATVVVTAILQAGRMSLDAGGAPVAIGYDEAGVPSSLTVVAQQ